jgi:hypothetical protein
MRLVNHLRNGADTFKIGAVRPNPVNPYVSDEQHSNLAFPFRFGTQQSRKQIDIRLSGFYDSHGFTSSSVIP